MTSESVLTNQQYKSFGPRAISGYEEGAVLWVSVRFDDKCGNGHNTFSITAHVTVPRKRDWEATGCLHDEIAQVFPELAHLIKWHLCSTDGPMHYLANTLYLAGERDCHGLLKGERRQIRNGKSGQPCWERVIVGADGEAMPLHTLPKHVDGERPTDSYRVEWRSWDRIGEGKERELDAARRSAVWLDATDEELTAPGLGKRLDARLPQLLADFRKDVEALGFVW